MTPPHVTYARALIGTRWSHRGRSSRRIDCVGMIAVVCAKAGRPIKDRKVYGKEAHEDGLREALVGEFGSAIPKDQAQVGDVGLFVGKVYPLHVGWIGDYAYGGLSIIHANNEPGVRKVCENRLGEQWLDRLIEVYRPVFPVQGA